MYDLIVPKMSPLCNPRIKIKIAVTITVTIILTVFWDLIYSLDYPWIEPIEAIFLAWACLTCDTPTNSNSNSTHTQTHNLILTGSVLLIRLGTRRAQINFERGYLSWMGVSDLSCGPTSLIGIRFLRHRSDPTLEQTNQ